MNVQQHLADIAATLGLPTLELNESGCARLLFDETIAVNFEHNEPEGKLSLYSYLGELPAGGREAFYRDMLVGNLLGLQTQDSTLGIDPELNEVVLSRSMMIEEISLEPFANMLDKFVGCAEYWTLQLENSRQMGTESVPTASEPVDFSRPMDGNLRV